MISKQIQQFGLPFSISINLCVCTNASKIGESMVLFLLEGYELTVAFTGPPKTNAKDLLTLVVAGKQYDLAVDTTKYMNLSVTINANLECTVYVKGEIKSAETLEKSPVFNGGAICSVRGINKVFKMGNIVLFDRVITSDEISGFMDYWLLV